MLNGATGLCWREAEISSSLEVEGANDGAEGEAVGEDVGVIDDDVAAFGADSNTGDDIGDVDGAT